MKRSENTETCSPAVASNAGLGAWIDIKVEKPEHGQKVLICTRGIVTAAITDTEFHGDGTIWWDGCGFGGYEWEYDFENDEVTHWMPLPEAPN